MRMRFLAGILITLLPNRYRARFLAGSTGDLRGPAIASALLQILLAFGLLIAGYFAYFDRRAGELEYLLLTQQKATNSLQLSGARAFAMLEYLVRPQSAVFVYLAVEGGVRLLGAVATEEIVPLLPMVLLERIEARLSARRRERQMGPRIPDIVDVGPAPEFSMRIASCRPKEGWHKLLTITYEERFYELVAEERGPRPRPYVYNLRLKPEGKVVRSIRAYSPQEVLQPQ